MSGMKGGVRGSGLMVRVDASRQGLAAVDAASAAAAAAVLESQVQWVTSLSHPLLNLVRRKLRLQGVLPSTTPAPACYVRADGLWWQDWKTCWMDSWAACVGSACLNGTVTMFCFPPAEAQGVVQRAGAVEEGVHLR